MLSRRAMLLSPLALIAARTGSRRLGQDDARHSPEHVRRGGLSQVARRLVSRGNQVRRAHRRLLDEFLKTDSLAAARPGPHRPGADTGLGCLRRGRALGAESQSRRIARESQETLRDVRDPGLNRIYAPTATTQKFTEDDYKAGVDNMRDVGEIAKQFHMTAMAEFMRTSSFISTLTTLLKMTRAAGASERRALLDCYHFWSGLNKLEDLDLIRPGEIGHVHFQDVPDMPRELLDNTTRFIPGDGISPLTRILRKLADKGYAGPSRSSSSCRKFQQGDP